MGPDHATDEAVIKRGACSEGGQPLGPNSDQQRTVPDVDRARYNGVLLPLTVYDNDDNDIGGLPLS